MTRDAVRPLRPDQRRVGQLQEEELLAEFLPLLRPAQGPSSASQAALPSAGPQAAEAAGAELVGPGDDCAVLDLTRGRTVMTTDTQTQGQDYLLEWPSGRRTSGRDQGWKSAAQNLADVAAMGARPVALLISLTLPPETPVSWVLDLARGYREALDALGASQCAVVGGDLGSGTELSATVTAVGTTSRDPVLRSGARPGDRLVLAGTLGRAAAGLDLLLDPHALAAADPVLEGLARDQLRPRPPVLLGSVLAQAGARAMVDVSDGLVRDAARLARASGVVLDLASSALAPDADLRGAGSVLGRDPWAWVLGGGEDHGLLACLPAETPLPRGVVAVGSCGARTEEGPLVTLDGTAQDIVGWDHFAAADRI